MSTAHRVVVHGGNRSGKTQHAIKRTLAIMSGQDILNKMMGWEPPIYWRWSGFGMNEQVTKVIVEWFRKMTPRDWLGGEFKYNAQTKMLRFAERGPCKGGWVEFNSYDQDPESGSGRPLHGWGADEAYKCSRRFRDQSLSRLLDYHGVAWAVETPEDGDATWSVDWYEKAKEGDPDYAAFRYPTRKNKYLYVDYDLTKGSPAIEQIIKDCVGDEIQLRIRLDGDFISIGGIVYPILSPGKHIITPEDFGVDNSWTRYLNIDPGLRKDHALIWSAVGPGRMVYFYRELYVGGTMEEMMLEARKAMGTERLAAVNFDCHWDWDNRTSKAKDGKTPANLKRDLRQAMDLTGFSDIDLIEAENRTVWSGIELVTSMLRPDPMTNKPNMAFSPECQRLNDEMRRYSCVRDKSNEPSRHNPRIRKIDDDGPDCVRIAVTCPMEWRDDFNQGVVLREVVQDEYGVAW